MRKLLTVLILTMLLASMGITLAAEREDKPPKASSTQALATAINQTQAENIAKQNATAIYNDTFTVKESELEREQGVLVWRVKIESANHTIEVLVNANTGAVIGQMKSEEKGKEKGVEKREEEHMRFNKSGDDYIGKFVSFTFNDSTMKIENYTLNNTTVFTSINISSFSDVEKIKVKGSEVKIEGEKDVKIDIHDNPTGLLKIDAEEGTIINLTVGSNIAITPTSNTTLKLNSSALEAILMIVGAGKPGIDYISVNGSFITVKLEHGKLIFRARPALDYGDRENRGKLEMEMARGHVGGELHIKGMKSYDVVIYRDVEINVTNVDTANKTINVSVSSDIPEGKFIVFNIDSEVLGAIQQGGYKVLIDGTAIPQANNLQDLIDAKAKNETSRYLVTIGTSGAQVIVYVQKFSEHVITIQGAAPSPVVPGFEALSFVVAIACIAFLRRRR
jgi:hypothetical protein